jgi:excisionase family DNA binding protein
MKLKQYNTKTKEFVEMEKSLIVQMKDRFEELSKKIEKQMLLQKEIFNFNETCDYLDLSASHLYKLTSQKRIPHFCPLGKKLYFNRKEVDNWLMSNKINIADNRKQKSEGKNI